MRNVEAKFRLSDLGRTEERARALGFEPRGLLTQRDTFFVTPRGKLKLREQTVARAEAESGAAVAPADGAMLIYYRRSDAGALKLSHYQIVPVECPGAMRAMLADALGVRAEVRKQRTLLTRLSIRMHLDRVDGLGDFGELEAVVGEEDSVEASRAEVNQILAALRIADRDLIAASYFEMLKPQMNTDEP